MLEKTYTKRVRAGREIESMEGKEGKKLTFGRGLRWVLGFLLIGVIVGGSFGIG